MLNRIVAAKNSARYAISTIGSSEPSKGAQKLVSEIFKAVGHHSQECLLLMEMHRHKPDSMILSPPSKMLVFR